jgi:hypothetical protein
MDVKLFHGCRAYGEQKGTPEETAIQAIEEKLAKNAVKYPVAKAKGSIRKYTEL